MLITTPHPTFVFFRSTYEWGPWRAYMDRFARMIRGELVPPPEKSKLITDPTVEHVLELAKLPFVTVDIETKPAHKARPWTGKDPTQARLKCVGMGCSTWGFSHLWVGNGPVKKEIKRVLEDPSILKVWQNGFWFDDRVLQRYGMKTVNVVDIRDMRRAVSSTSKVGLGPMGAIYTDYFAWKQAEEEESDEETGALK